MADGREPQVAHGLILRCFIKRWLGWPIDFSFPMMLDPGAVTVLRYAILVLMPYFFVAEPFID
jgi:probable phosphoglycerate mutase